jgi:hypothetical protein
MSGLVLCGLGLSPILVRSTEVEPTADLLADGVDVGGLHTCGVDLCDLVRCGLGFSPTLFHSVQVEPTAKRHAQSSSMLRSHLSRGFGVRRPAAKRPMRVALTGQPRTCHSYI